MEKQRDTMWQEDFMKDLMRVEKTITVFLINGFQMHGTIQGYDDNVIILETTTGQCNMIYKHAISTIA